MTTVETVDQLIKALTLKELRVQLRARGLQPAGGQEALSDRLKQHMIETKDFALKSESGEDMAVVTVTAGQSSASTAAGKGQNNYSRPSGQNTGNFMTDRPSSRVTHAPGGASQIVFGESAPQDKFNNNNYARPGGQNTGNFLTEKNSSRVLAPPGGKSQIFFG